MQDPQAHEILTAGAVLLAVYIGVKELKAFQSLKGTKGKLPTKENLSTPPKPLLVPGEDAEDDAGLDASQSCTKVKGNPQTVIAGSGGGTPQLIWWSPNCQSQENPNDCQSFGSKVYCMCWNNQPLTYSSSNGSPEQAPPTGPIKGSPMVWHSNGYFYNNNGSTYLIPAASNDPSKQKWSGGPMTVNPALYGAYPALLWSNLLSKFPHLS